jgi:anti-sigma B factor antagonist
VVAGTTGDQARAGSAGDGTPGPPRLAMPPGPARLDDAAPRASTARPPTPPLAVEVADRNGTVTVVVRGELDMATVPALRALLRPLLDSEPEQVIFELTGLTFTDCAGARAITGTGWRLPGSVKPVLRHAAPAVRRVLELTGLSDLCHLEPD